jgi:hypothetical protein
LEVIAMSSLSEEIDVGFEDALLAHDPRVLEEAATRHPFLAGMSARDLVSLALDRPARRDRKDQLWTAVVDCYRHGPRAFWGPVILQMLSPTLLRKATRLFAEGQLAEFDEDIRHQLIAALLSAAARERVPTRARWIPNRLSTRAVTTVRRSMAAETRSRCLYLQDLPEPPAEPDPDPLEFASMLVRLKRLGVSEATTILLYRHRVLGEPLEWLARELGTTEEALQMRRLRAEARIRRRLAA